MIKQTLIFLGIAYAGVPLHCMVHNDSVFFATKQLFNCACTGEDSDLINTYLEHGGNVLATDYFGRTPLVIASQQQAYWERQPLDLRFSKKEIKKHSRDFLTTVKKIRYAEQQAKKRLATKPHEKFTVLCTCATYEVMRALAEETKNTFKQAQTQKEKTDSKTSMIVEEPTLAERLIHITSRTKNLRKTELNKQIKKTVNQESFIQEKTQKIYATSSTQQDSLSKSSSFKPLKDRVQLTISIPEKTASDITALKTE